jgi:topoisomerase (DNA) II binding protein 1
MSNNNSLRDLLRDTLSQNLQTAEDENNWQQVDNIHNLLDEPTLSEISAQFTKIDDLTETESKEIKENEKMCISFSNFPHYQSSMDEFRGKYVAFFESKGFKISSDNLFDPETTHLVARKICRSEKMLGSIASGKWILHPSYIEACFTAKKILSNFTNFEWGNPENGFLQEVTDNERNELELAQAAFSLRQFINENPSKGIFTGIRAIIHTKEDRKGAFARLILAGKGFVIQNAKPPYIDAKEATHCFAEPQKLPNKHLSLKSSLTIGLEFFECQIYYMIC